MFKYLAFFLSYLATGFLLSSVDLGKLDTTEKSILVTAYLDLVFLMIMLMLTHKTRHYFTSMGMALVGNSFGLALIGVSMIHGFSITNPIIFLLFAFTALFLSISFETLYQDIVEHILEMEDSEYFYEVGGID